MKITAGDSTLTFNENDYTAVIEGSLRLANLLEYDVVLDFLNKVSEKTQNSLILDLRELRFLNSSGITTLSMFILDKKKLSKPKITVLGSNLIPWQEKSLKNFNKLWDEVLISIQ